MPPTRLTCLRAAPAPCASAARAAPVLARRGAHSCCCSHCSDSIAVGYRNEQAPFSLAHTHTHTLTHTHTHTHTHSHTHTSRAFRASSALSSADGLPLFFCSVCCMCVCMCMCMCVCVCVCVLCVCCEYVVCACGVPSAPAPHRHPCPLRPDVREWEMHVSGTHGCVGTDNTHQGLLSELLELVIGRRVGAQGWGRKGGVSTGKRGRATNADRTSAKLRRVATHEILHGGHARGVRDELVDSLAKQWQRGLVSGARAHTHTHTHSLTHTLTHTHTCTCTHTFTHTHAHTHTHTWYSGTFFGPPFLTVWYSLHV
jgi:hypothetical protein